MCVLVESRIRSEVRARSRPPFYAFSAAVASRSRSASLFVVSASLPLLPPVTAPALCSRWESVCVRVAPLTVEKSVQDGMIFLSRLIDSRTCARRGLNDPCIIRKRWKEKLKVPPALDSFPVTIHLMPCSLIVASESESESREES